MSADPGGIKHNIGDIATDCPHCGGGRVWRHAKRNGAKWRRYCSKCHNAISYRSRKKRLPAYNLRRSVRRQTDPVYRGYEIWKAAKDRAKQKNIEFSLSRSDIARAVQEGICRITGLKFDLILKRKRLGPLSPSIDRIDQTKGYIPDNIQVVCWLYNRAKGDGTHEDVLMLAEALMPSKSQKQHNFMEAAAHDPKFASRNNIPQSVAREFVNADKAKGIKAPEPKKGK